MNEGRWWKIPRRRGMNVVLARHQQIFECIHRRAGARLLEPVVEVCKPRVEFVVGHAGSGSRLRARARGGLEATPVDSKPAGMSRSDSREPFSWLRGCLRFDHD